MDYRKTSRHCYGDPIASRLCKKMEERSRRRVRDLVTQLAFQADPRMRSNARGYP
jgi:hypothetical protein